MAQQPPINIDLLLSQRPQYPQTRVVGVGDCGCQALDHIAAADGGARAKYVAVNTFHQSLRYSRAETRVEIGKDVTGGLGAGGDPLIGRQAAEKHARSLAGALKGADRVILVAGLGGGTGTGALPVLAQIARGLNVKRLEAVVSRPFMFEGAFRRQFADVGLTGLRLLVNEIILIPADDFYVTGEGQPQDVMFTRLLNALEWVVLSRLIDTYSLR